MEITKNEGKKTTENENTFSARTGVFADFSSRLRQLMSEQHLRTEDLADLLSVNVATITGYRIGRRSPNIEMLAQIAEKLSVSTDYLLGLCDEPQGHREI